MAGIVITATSGKGGVGKTTTIANIAVALGLLGNRVIAVDADIGLRNLDLVLGLENRIIYDLVDVVEGRCRLQQALVRDTRVDKLFMLAAAQTRDKSDVTPEQMLNLCGQLRQMADIVLIDSPAGIEHGFQNAVAPADRTLIITTPDVSSLRDADKVIYLLERDWKCQPGLIINRFNPKLANSGAMRDIDDILDILAVDLIGVVPDDSNIVLTTDRGIPAVLDQNMAVRQAYLNIAQRILGNNVPLMDFREKGMRARFARWFGRG
ncbi:MAG: septum site-determining protein MinD [Caldilineaceae bacterium]|nr:septum site-determining protein MinD [Caldilineaceae bacterium]